MQQVVTVEQRIAEELEVAVARVQAAVALLDEGSTVPFIARYRKEVTGGLDDTQLRTLEERLRYLRELDDRRQAILESIETQGKLDDELRQRILAADTKARLEDLYLPFKPKRRTKAMIAREAGLEPLADALLGDPSLEPVATAEAYVDPAKEVPDSKTALDGARAILIERFADDGDLIGELRELLWQNGRLVSTVRDGKEKEGAKFSDYFDFSESFTTLPSHRILALYRGETEDVLAIQIAQDEGADDQAQSRYEKIIADRFGIAAQGRAADTWLVGVVRWAWRTKIMITLGIDMRMRLRQHAEEEAVRVFAANVKDLLLAAPAGTRATLGLDPGFRTGVKVAVVDRTGKVVATDVIYPHVPKHQWDQSIATLARLAKDHQVELIAIGNGTASRETEKLTGELIKKHPELELTKAVVSEAGASVYSASAFASQELPDMDVSLRGAVSIARRLQDPLAELVKIDPKSIGVGQYQHDLGELALSRSLDAVVEDCVNAVGVDLNTASVPLLTRVSGITSGLAENIAAHRDQHGPFRSRAALLEVARLGPKAYEQAAGFLRISDGEDPLDSSGVHPESYPVVRRILSATGTELKTLIGNSTALRTINAAEFTDERFGLPTVTDILTELDKPGRDPRPAFQTAAFADGVETLADLTRGMILEGQVTNVAAFGAFIDIGVHQDGLAHVSALSKNFVKDPREVVKPGDLVKVKVLDVDHDRKRISLTLRLDDDLDAKPGDAKPGRSRQGGAKQGGAQQGGAQQGERKPREGKPGGGKPGEGKGGEGKSGRDGDRNGRGRGGRPKPRQEREPQGAMADAFRRAGYTR